MNTIDVIKIYHQIVDSAPDIQVSGADGYVHEAYTRQRIHELLLPFMTGTWVRAQQSDGKED